MFTMNNFPEIIERIKIVCSCQTEGDVAKAIGISKNALSNHKSRGSLPFEALFTFCVSNNISADWLFMGMGSPSKDKEDEVSPCQHEKPVSANLLELPYVRNDYHPGGSAQNFVISSDWVKKVLDADPENLKMLTIFDDSMEPTLENGDQVILDCKYANNGKTFPDGIYALNIDGQLLVKRLQKLPKGVLRIVSDNSAYEPFQMNLDNNSDVINVVGRVVWIGKIS
ncbi:MAG: S24 family peptidase [Geobacteraceae bacterium]|nr:S24 family peptidase [Geobacteraceae bacterium]